MPTVRRDLLYIVAWADPSGGLKKGQGHSRSAIVVVGEDDMQRIFILQAFARHCTTSFYIDEIFKAYLNWHPAIFGVDATATQITFYQGLVKEAHTRQLPVPFRPFPLRSDKVFQIEHTLQPVSSGGRLFRPPIPLCKELEEEWLNFPGDTYRDCMDALSNAIRLLPSASIPGMRDLTQDQYKRYLERSGYTEDEIKAKLALR